MEKVSVDEESGLQKLTATHVCSLVMLECLAAVRPAYMNLPCYMAAGASRFLV